MASQIAEPKVVLVTGAARGIGHAVAASFAADGHHVLGLDLIAEQEPTIGGSFDLRACNVADEQQVSAAVNEPPTKDGHIDVVANIAGVVVVGPLDSLTWEDYRRVVDVNLGGIFLICKYLLPVMKATRSGVIVNAGSVSAHVGQIDHTALWRHKGGHPCPHAGTRLGSGAVRHSGRFGQSRFGRHRDAAGGLPARVERALDEISRRSKRARGRAGFSALGGSGGNCQGRPFRRKQWRFLHHRFRRARRLRVDSEVAAALPEAGPPTGMSVF